MNTQKKCLVTGGAGFIGSHLCEFLLKRGYAVICVDNLITGNKNNLSSFSSDPKFKFILHDVTQPLSPTLFPALSGLSFIYHLASVASPPQYRKYAIQTLLTNSVGTYFTLELARQMKIGYLLASTSEVYGNPTTHPQKESYFGNVNPVGLRACYDEAKRFAEALAMEYVRKYDLKVKIIRIFNTFGPRMQKDDGRVISNFVNQAIENQPLTVYGDGKQTRSFCYISDMIEGLVAAAESQKAGGEVINLGNPQEYTIEEIAHKILSLTGSKSPIVNSGKRLGDDPDRRRPDISKAKTILGWTPKVKLQEGLKKTIDYFKNQ